MPEATSPGQRTGLQQRRESLVQEHRSEREAAEELRCRLLGEMGELRDQCDEQGQMVDQLMQRLSDARGAVTADLRDAQAVRAVLGDELACEESRRRALEEAGRSEEAEFAGRVGAARRQLAAMAGARASLGQQLHDSELAQARLRNIVAAERSGRAQLRLAGEQEFEVWNEQNSRAYGELRHDLESESAELERWRSAAGQELSELQQESSMFANEENALRAELQSAKDKKMACASAAQHEGVDELHAQLREIEKELARVTDVTQRLVTVHGACGCERAGLWEELEQCRAAARAGELDLRRVNERRAHLHQELQRLCESGEGVYGGDTDAAQRYGAPSQPPLADGVRGARGGAANLPEMRGLGAPLDTGAGIDFTSDEV